MSNIAVPISVLKKIASFAEAVPAVLATFADTTKSASVDNTKQAQECVTGLIEHAGLLSEKRSSFEGFILTNDGALKTINSLTHKIASLTEELEASNSQQTKLGGPSSKRASSSAANTASQVWCDTLLS